MVFNSFFVVTKNVRLEEKTYLLGIQDWHANPGWYGNLDLWWSRLTWPFQANL